MLGQYLDKLGNKVNVFISEKNHQPKVLSMIFKSYEKLVLEKKVPSNFFWKRISNSFIVWAEDLKGSVVSGIIFEINSDWQAGLILLTFTDPNFENRGLNKICFKHYVEKSKKEGAIRTLGLAFIGNTDVIKTDLKREQISWGGGRPSYVIYTKKLI